MHKLNGNVGTAFGVGNEEATLAHKNSYPREYRGQGHRLLFDCELAATHADIHRQAELEEALPKIRATAHTERSWTRGDPVVSAAERASTF
jgi:hypothetical protein